jgi:4-carboxymuconolactone decarboxylase
MGLFRKVYRHNARAVLNSLHALHPLYDRWVLEDAYGRVLSRSLLAGRTRELCAVAALTVSGVPQQLRSHIMGAIHLGARPEEVEGMIRSMEALEDGKKIHVALEILTGLNLK